MRTVGVCVAAGHIRWPKAARAPSRLQLQLLVYTIVAPHHAGTVCVCCLCATLYVPPFPSSQGLTSFKVHLTGRKATVSLTYLLKPLLNVETTAKATVRTDLGMPRAAHACLIRVNPHHSAGYQVRPGKRVAALTACNLPGHALAASWHCLQASMPAWCVPGVQTQHLDRPQQSQHDHLASNSVRTCKKGHYSL